jgi:hypothetical protein
MAMRKSLIFLIAVVVAVGCSWDNEETFYPDAEVCDTIDVSFSMDIQPLLANNCYTCHSNANAPEFGNGTALEEYADVSASSQIIVGAINRLPGFPAMPKGSEKLDTCSIKTFESWVTAGKPDN